MLKKKVIHDPFLDEFLYNLIFKANRNQRERVPENWQHVFQTGRAAKRFCSKSTMEQKMYFLSLLGIDWFMVFANRKTTVKDLKGILNQFKNDNPADALEDMSEKNVFVFSNDQFLDYLGIMATIDHHKTYSYNLALQKTGYSLKKWNHDKNHKLNAEVSEAKEYYGNVVKYSLSMMLNEFGIETNHSIKRADLMLLFYLYGFKNVYIHHDAISDYFSGFLTKGEVTISIKRLRDFQFIRLGAIAKSKEYIITGLGINKLNQFLSKTLITNF